MSLVEKVSEELKKSMLARNAARTTGLRMIRAAFIELEKEGKGAVTDDRCLEALRRMKKQREESIAIYDQQSRADLAEQERVELAVIEGLLPAQADEAQTLVWVKEAIVASGATNPKEVGKVMGVLMKSHKNDVDSALVKALILRELGG